MAQGTDFEAYRTVLAALLAAPGSLDDALAAAERAGLGELNRALAAERDVRGEAAALSAQFESLNNRVMMLCQSIGGGDCSQATVDLRSPADAARVVKGLATDVSSAESALTWIHRTEQAQRTAPLPPPAPALSAIPGSHGIQDGDDVTAPSRRGVSPFVWVALAIAVALLVAFVVMR